MKKFLFLSFLGMTFSLSYAQNFVVSAKILDAESREALPSASIYIDTEKSTIANADGEFNIEASQTDVLTISYVGYYSVRVKAENVGMVVELTPYSIELNEVKVLPLEKILENLRSNIEKEINMYKTQESNFFYRQTTTNDGECCEYIEAFFNGYSEIALRGVSLITGRYGALRSSQEKKYPYLTNYHTYSCVSPYAPKIDKRILVYPLVPDYEKFYNVDYDVLTDNANENTIYKITFMPRPSIKNAIVKGVIYIDANSYRILKYEGEIFNNRVIFEGGKREPMQVSFSVNYTHHRGFTEVQSVTTSGRYLDRDKSTITLNSTLYNVGKKYFKGKNNLGDFSNLRKKIFSIDYEPYFWKDNVIVKRTPTEEQVVKMFEKENVFSNIKE